MKLKILMMIFSMLGVISCTPESTVSSLSDEGEEMTLSMSGSELYAEKCQSCHGELKSTEISNRSKAHIEFAISVKSGAMSYLSVLESEQLAAIADALAVDEVPIKSALNDLSSIGRANFKANSNFDNGVYLIESSGSFIGSDNDEFLYVYTVFEGDGQIVAKVEFFSNFLEDSRAGVMIRESLTEDSSNVFSYVNSNFISGVQLRTQAGEVTANVGSNSTGNFIAMTRKGDLIRSFSSNDGGNNWTEINSQLIKMNQRAYVGLAFFSLDSLKASSAVFNSVTVSKNITINPDVELAILDGKLLYKEACSVCHFPLKKSNKKNRSFLQIKNAIVDNVGGMSTPALNVLTEGEIEAISTALIDVPPVETPFPSASLDGLVLYADNCMSCHNSIGQSTRENKTFAQIKSAIENNAGGVMNTLKLLALSDEQLHSIVSVLKKEPGEVSPPPPLPAKIDAKNLYENACMVCHNNFDESDIKNASFEQIKSAIFNNAGNVMNTPALLALVNEQLQALSVALIADPPVEPPALEMDGAVLYSNYCMLCHDVIKVSIRKNRTFEQIKEAIAINAGGLMNNARLLALTDAQLQAIASALRDSNAGFPREMNGAVLYKNQCESCHKSLSLSSKKNKTFDEIKNAIISDTGRMGTVELIALQDDQLNAIAAVLLVEQSPPLECNGSEQVVDVNALNRYQVANTINDLFKINLDIENQLPEDFSASIFLNQTGSSTIDSLYLEVLFNIGDQIYAAINENSLAKESLYVCDQSEGNSCILKIINNILPKAFRKSLSGTNTNKLYRIVSNAETHKNFEQKIRSIIQYILVNPYFLHKIEDSTSAISGENGVYYLWARAKGLSTGTDSFYFSFNENEFTENNRINNLKFPLNEYSWYRPEVLDGMTDIILTPGENRFNILNRERGVRIDKILITNDINYDPNVTQIVANGKFSHEFEAENPNEIISPFSVVDDAEALNGKALVNLADERNMNASALISPGKIAKLTFVFNIPQNSAGVDDGITVDELALSSHEIAQRLSYGLYGSLPDDLLRASADSGLLISSDEIEVQVKRLLASDKVINHLADRFVVQWLTLNKIEELAFNKNKYPNFDQKLKDAMFMESKLLVKSIIQGNRPLKDVLITDYSFINQRLADHYGISGITGEQMRQVTLSEESYRGGILSHAGILSQTSTPDKPSVVQRGLFVLDRFLCTTVALPANVNELLEEPPEENSGVFLSSRDRLKAHTDDPNCSSCHNAIDPYAFGQLNFGALGEYRDKEVFGEAGMAGKAAFFIWARAKADAGSNDSFFFAFDEQAYTENKFNSLNTPFGEYAWYQPEIGATDIQLSSGVHKLKIRNREALVNIDKFLMTNDANFNPNTAENLVDGYYLVEIEAENPDQVLAPFVIIDDALASGGKALVPQSGKYRDPTAALKAGEIATISYSFNIDAKYTETSGTENSLVEIPIDASSTLATGESFNGVIEMQAAMHKRPEFRNCSAFNLSSFVLGTSLNEKSRCQMTKILNEDTDISAQALLLEFFKSSTFRQNANKKNF